MHAAGRLLPKARRSNIPLFVKGNCARARTLRTGDRRIMALLAPGDLCDVEVFVLEGMDHDIVALTETNCVLIPANGLAGVSA